MRTALHDPPPLQHDDKIGAADGGQSMRDSDGRVVFRQGLQRLGQGLLGADIKRTGGFIKQQHRWIAQDGASQRQALFLSPPEKRWPRSPTSVSYPSGSAPMTASSCAALAAANSSLIGRIRLGETQVVSHRGMQQVRLLGNHAEHVGQ